MNMNGALKWTILLQVCFCLLLPITMGGGHYMYIETSKPRVSGEKARLISPTICNINQLFEFLVFYYHMYGSNINTLNVYLSQNGRIGSPVWTKSGSQGNAWKKARVQIAVGSKAAGTTNIVFEGLRGGEYKGDIAIDDISLIASTSCQVPLLVHIEPNSDVIRINEGKNLTLKCVIENYFLAATSITWSHKGQNSSGPTFHIQNVTRSDEGRLTCTAHVGVGTNPGWADTFIRVVEKSLAQPLVHIEPNSDVITINEGENLTVKCVIDKGRRAVTSITWSRRGQITSGSMFQIQNVTLSDEGRLTCTAHSGVGTSPGHADTFIRVVKKSLEPTIVRIEPHSDMIKIDEGGNLTVKCLIDNANAAVNSIAWSHKGRISFGSTFYIQNVNVSDKGRLTCTAHNGVGSSSGRTDTFIWVAKTYQAPPQVHIQPNSDVIRINEGKNLTVKCVIDKNGSAATSIMWTHKGRNSSGFTFHIQKVTQSDEGRLTCTARSGVGSNPGRADAFIRVVEESLEPAVVRIEPNSDILRVEEGANLTVNCLIDDVSAAVSSIRWSHKGRASSGSPFHIQNVTQSDEGRLTCTAHNGEGSNPGRADTFIHVVKKYQERLVTGASTCTPIRTGAVIAGVVAVVVIVFLVLVIIHVCRKQGSASVKKTQESMKMVAASNLTYDKDDDEAVYEVVHGDITSPATAMTTNNVQKDPKRKPHKKDVKTNLTSDQDESEKTYENVDTVDKVKTQASKAERKAEDKNREDDSEEAVYEKF